MRLDAMVRPDWPPLRHVRRGWDALTDDEQALVEGRVETVLAATRLPDDVPRPVLLRFFSFLAQVETIAIEIPLRFLDHCPPEQKRSLRRQLCDEVFHSVVFARLAHDLAAPDARPPAPLASAERMLEQIRAQPDLGITATLLNLAAEGWIETLFRHARKWGVADAVFQAVLEDEARHVHEATDYTTDLDLDAARDALHELEKGLVEVGAEPPVALSMARIAGVEGYRKLTEDLHQSHARHLAVVGLEPGEAWSRQVEVLERLLQEEQQLASTPVEDSSWSRAARHIWNTPRDPTMQGHFDVQVGHIPKKLLTTAFVAAVGRAWAKHPRFNRVLAQDGVHQLPRINVGVRVKLSQDELATVVIPDAETRSLKDIAWLIQDGVAQLRALREHAPDGLDQAPEIEPDMMGWLAPTGLHFSVGVSNVGRFGLVTGAGAFTGALSPSTDLTIGLRRKLPVWRKVAYVPAAHIGVGALQDHRVHDGQAAGEAMQAIMAELTPKAFRSLRKAPDTLPHEHARYDQKWFDALPADLRLLPMAGISKYLPIALGGAAIGTGVAVGGYFLFQTLNSAGAAAGGAAGAAGGAAGTAGATAGTPPGQAGADATQGPSGGAGAEQAAASAPFGVCQGTTASGAPCKSPAGDNGFCWRHGGA